MRTPSIPGRLAVFATAAALLAACHASPRKTDPADTPPPWPLPPGWKSETIPFPLEFAPDIAHQGVEELRFMPGFLDPQAQGYWSYAFLWWLRDRAPQTGDALAAELVSYFRGLSLAVGGKKFTMDPARFTAQLGPATDVPPDEKAQVFDGQTELYDAFKTGLPLLLQVRAYQLDCPQSEHRAVLVLASSKPRTSPQWQELLGRRAAFNCQ